MFGESVDEFIFSKEIEVSENVDFGYIRLDTQKCSIVGKVQHMRQMGKWKHLQSLIKVEST